MLIEGGSANIINGTIGGNHAIVGGGLRNLATVALTNTVVSGNTAPLAGPDTDGGFTDNGGNIISTPANLSPLGSYGGPTPTILPLPGSIAICAGTLAKSTAAGVTTDQRGYGFNPNCPAGLVDAGAAQTNYALSFTQSPANGMVGQALSPSAIVTVTERGLPLTAGAATVSLTDRSGTLAGSTSGSTSTTNGQATFSSLTVGAAITNDVLTATLPLNPSLTPALTVTAASNSFSINQTTPVVTWATPAAITYGTALNATQLNATASVPGSFAYTPTAATVLGAGSKILSVKFTPTSTNYLPVTKTVTLLINQAAPIVIWPAPAAITYGTPLGATQLDAIVSVPGKFRYAPTTGAVLAAGQQRICLAFTPTDSVDYKPAANSVMLTVKQATTTTTLSIVTMQTLGGTIATITPLVKPQIGGSPTGTMTYWNGSTVLGSAAAGAVFTTPVLPAGTDKISAVYHGDANFITSTSVQTSITGVAPTTVDFTVVCTKLIYPQPAVYGVVVPLVNGKAITGSVTIFDGTVAVSTTPIQARGILVGITLPPLKVGTHILKAVYSGGNYPPGQSAPQTVTVVSK